MQRYGRYLLAVLALAAAAAALWSLLAARAAAYAAPWGSHDLRREARAVAVVLLALLVLAAREIERGIWGAPLPVQLLPSTLLDFAVLFACGHVCNDLAQRAVSAEMLALYGTEPSADAMRSLPGYAATFNAALHAARRQVYAAGYPLGGIAAFLAVCALRVRLWARLLQGAESAE